MLDELTEEEIREINKEGGSVKRHGKNVSALRRPEEADKSKQKVESNELAGVLKQFIESQGNDMRAAIDELKDIVAKQPASAPEVNMDLGDVTGSIADAIKKGLANAPKKQRVKFVDIKVTTRERDPRLGLDVASGYRVTPTYEDAK